MKQLPYIEDYILLMAADKLIWPPTEPIINLARYDELIVNNMSDQIHRGLGFTDKQAQLAHKLVIKYKKQWYNAGYDISRQLDNAIFRLPIRTIDRSRIIEIIDNKILIRFPYDQAVISYLRANITDIAGSLKFDKDKRVWVSPAIEQRIIWAYEFGSKHGFDFADTFIGYYHNVINYPSYEIKLVNDSGQYKIKNAAASLLEYLDQYFGSAENNIIQWIDMSSILGYTVDDQVFVKFVHELDAAVVTMLLNRVIDLKYENEFDLTHIIKYAKLTNRFPIYVYEMSAGSMLQQLEQHFKPEEISDKKNIIDTTKVVYTHNWKMDNVRIPLLVTDHIYMVGHRRQQMLQCAEKVVYFSRVNSNG